VLGRFGPARAQPGRNQLFPRPREVLLKLPDLRLQPVFHCYGLGGGGGRLSQGPFGILEFLPGASGALGRLLRPLPLFRCQPSLFLRGALRRGISGPARVGSIAFRRAAGLRHTGRPGSSGWAARRASVIRLSGD
jgi:hypothetical protein